MANTVETSGGRRPGRAGAWSVLAAMLVAAAVLLPRAYLVNAAHTETCDEDVLLLQGTEFWHRDPGLVHRLLNDPHLGQALGALPLVLMGADSHTAAGDTVLYGQPYAPEAGLRAVALWKAALFVPFVGVVFWWVRRLYGAASAWLAVALLLVEPTIAGHVHLGALDVIGTSGIVAACILGWRYFERPGSSWRLVGAGLGCAAALMLKHTGVIVPPVLILMAGLWWWRRRGTVEGRRLWRSGVDLARGIAVTVLAMWVLTGFDVSPPAKGRALPGGIYLHSMLEARQHVKDANFAVLHGRVKKGSWWYYYFAVAVYKVPIGVWGVLALGAASVAWRRPRWEEMSLAAPAGAYTLFMMLQSVNLGWRHFLPAYVLFMLLASRCVARGAAATAAAPADAEPPPEHGPSRARSRAVAALAWVAVVTTAVDAARWHPDTIAYVNWPRPDVHLQISDSNLDWGQGLKQVRAWIDGHPDVIRGRPVYLRPFGTTNRAVRHYVGSRAVHLRFSDRLPAGGGVLIISPVIEMGLQESGDGYGWLRGQAPDDVIGHTLRVYDLDRLAARGVVPPERRPG